MATELDRLLELLCVHEVDCVVVGGLAAVLQGAPIVTFDVDIVHERSVANIARLIAALSHVEARYRTHPDRVIRPRADALTGPGHSLFTTTVGQLDALGALNGSDYEALLPDSVVLDFGGHSIRVLRLERLIEIKRAAGRPKDLRVLPELEATLRRIAERG